MSAVEQEIIEKVRKLPPKYQIRVLEFINGLAIADANKPPERYSALELWALPYDERSRIMTEAFERAADEDFEIFEAYSEEGFDDE